MASSRIAADSAARRSSRHARNLKPLLAAAGMVVAPLMSLALPHAASAADLYWDGNDIAAGAGTAPTGSWGVDSFWNTAADGTAAVGAWVDGENAIFSAGADAVGPFTVTIGAPITAGAITIEEGTVFFTGAQSATSAGATTINAGATLSIDGASRLGGTGPVVLNGGTIQNTSTTAGSTSFLTSAKELQIGAAGGTVQSSTTGVSLYSGTITGAGNTLTKTGAAEFRYQGAGTANTTFSKLVVKEGLYRLGSVVVNTVQTTSELGFGAAPESFTADAITLDGGGIGASFGLTTHANRGVTLTANGGTLNGSAGAITIGAPLVGTGPLTVTGTATLNEDSNAGQVLGTGTLAIASGKTFTTGGAADFTFGGRIGGSGTFVKTGVGVMALNPASLEWSNTGTIKIEQGSIRYDTAAAGFAASTIVDISAGANLDLNVTNDTFGNLTGAGNVINSTGTARNLSLGGGTSNLTFTGQIVGAINVTKINTASTLTIASPQSYTGNTSIAVGSKLYIAVDNALPIGTSFRLNNATFDLTNQDGNSFNQQVGSYINLANAGLTPVITNTGANRKTFTISGSTSSSLKTSTVDSWTSIQGNLTLAKGGTSTLTLSGSNNTFTGGLVIDGGVVVANADANLGAVPGAPDSANITFGGGTLQLAAAFNPDANRGIALNAGGGTIDTNAFDSTIAAPIAGVGGFTKAGLGTLTVNNVRSGDLAVNAGVLSVKPDGTAAGTSRVGLVSVAADAKLNLNDNKLITSSPAGTFTGTAYDGVSGLVDSARGSAGNALWDGTTGITTTDTRAINNGDLVSIGVAKVANVRTVTDTETTTFAGQTVLGTDTIAMVTWGGDANLDGKINIDDYGRIDGNVGQSGTVFGWDKGDFNYDGKINIDDYGIIDGNINRQGAVFATGGGATSVALEGVAAVPEPASLSLLALGATALMRRRRRVN